MGKESINEKESGEKILERLSNKNKDKKRKTLIIIIFCLTIIVFFFLVFAIILYTTNLQIKLKPGADIKEALITEDGAKVYLKLAGGSNEKNISKIIFRFKDKEGKSYVFETSEGLGEISIPFETSWLDIFKKPELRGVYNYEIDAENAGLDSFKGIVEVSVSYEYKTDEGKPVGTPPLDTTKPSTTTRGTTTTGTGEGGGGGSGGSSGGTQTECTPESQSATCTNWICGTKNNNCAQPVTCGTCENNFSCANGICINEIENCTDYRGIDYSIKDYVYLNENIFWDFCDNNTITEFTCYFNGSIYEVRNQTSYCPNFCSNGACNSCTDSDNGLVYNITGNVLGAPSCVIQEDCPPTLSTDYCEDNTNLIEFYCLNNLKYINSYQCPFGCISGVCLAGEGVTGLVSHWKFEGNGNDETGRNNGTLIGGATIFADAEKGQVLKLDGIDSSVKVPDSDSLDITGNITLSAWVKAVNSGTKIIVKPTAGGVDPWEVYAIDLNSQTVRFIISNGSSGGWYGVFNQSINFALNSWHHIAGVYDKNSMKLYIDGQLQEAKMYNYNGSFLEVSSVTANIATNNEDLLIGSYFNNSCCQVNGSIDDVMIYNRALTNSEIQQIYDSQKPSVTQPTGFIAYWKFESDGRDETGRNNGTLMNGASIFNDAEKGNVLKLDGIDGLLNISDSPELSGEIGKDFTWLFWFYIANETNAGSDQQQLLVKHKNSSFKDWGFSTDYDNITNKLIISFFAENNGSFRSIHSPNISVRKWQHIAATWDSLSKNATLYLEGVKVNETNFNIDLFDTNANVLIGKRAYGSQSDWLNGSVDDVMIYDKVLNETEIQQIYDSQKPAGFPSLKPEISFWNRVIEFFKRLLGF